MSSTLVLDAPSMTPRCPSMSTGWPAVGPRPQAPRGADEREGEDEQTTHICSERFKHDVACGIARLGGRSARWKRRGTQGRGRHLRVSTMWTVSWLLLSTLSASKSDWVLIKCPVCPCSSIAASEQATESMPFVARMAERAASCPPALTRRNCCHHARAAGQ
jgi:hypothetical protein